MKNVLAPHKSCAMSSLCCPHSAPSPTHSFSLSLSLFCSMGFLRIFNCILPAILLFPLRNKCVIMIANRRRSINAQQQQQHRGIGCMKGMGKGAGRSRVGEGVRGCGPNLCYDCGRGCVCIMYGRTFSHLGN